MTDITRLLASLKRRSSRVKEFGDDITFVKLKDIDALVEELEKAQTKAVEQGRTACELFDEVTTLRQRIAELESRTVTVKLPNQTQFDDPLSAYEAIEKCKEALTAEGIKWEAE
ncbi:hypothetical protein SH589_06595 [Klebsiella aerogenes]|uniref:hypothetical protein n=1 Tax=Klebsiella aerogenes TaxID=548 RepID=UPI002E13CB23|nr:hypothetical protein SH589_06595 [Klebsiella aerogenes]